MASLIESRPRAQDTLANTFYDPPLEVIPYQLGHILLAHVSPVSVPILPSVLDQHYLYSFICNIKVTTFVQGCFEHNPIKEYQELLSTMSRPTRGTT